MRKRNFLTLTISLLFIFITNNAVALAVYGHRGARGLSPENTFPAYQTALSVGVDYVDMDIGMTKDGVLVICHNFRLNPNITKNAKGEWISTPIPIKDLTFKQLETYDVGELKPGTDYAKLFPNQWPVPNTHMPSLKSVIDYVKRIAGNKVGFQIEIKTTPEHPDWTFSPEKIAAALAKLIEEEDIIDRTQVQSFDFRALLAIQKDNQNIITAYLTDEEQQSNFLSSDPKKAGLWTAGYLLKNYNDSIPQMVKALGGKYWDPQERGLTAEQVAEAHKLGLTVIVWPWRQYFPEVNTNLLEKMITMQVDGIITGRPDILRGLMAARGMKIPEGFPLSGKSYP